MTQEQYKVYIPDRKLIIFYFKLIFLKFYLFRTDCILNLL